MLLNNEWVNNKIKEEIKKFLKTNENELTTVQTLWDTAEAVLRGNFIAIWTYLEKFQINNLTYKNWRNNNRNNPEQVEERK